DGLAFLTRRRFRPERDAIAMGRGLYDLTWPPEVRATEARLRAEGVAVRFFSPADTYALAEHFRAEFSDWIGFFTRSGSVAAGWARTLGRLRRRRIGGVHGVRTVRHPRDTAGRAHAAGGPALALCRLLPAVHGPLGERGLAAPLPGRRDRTRGALVH